MRTCNDLRSWKLLIELVPASRLPLQLQIRQGIVDAIRSNRLPAGTRIASTRILAQALGVGRNTIVLAIQSLVADQILEVRERRGFYVASRPPGTVDQVPEQKRMETAQIGARHLRIHPAQQPYTHRPHNWSELQFPFLHGQLDLSFFPTVDWRECTRAALSASEIQGWTQDLGDGDYQPLIEQLRVNILPRRGIWAAPDEIILTMGAQHALFLAANLLCGPNRTVAFEDPGYPDARSIFSAMGSQIVPVPVDDDGIVTSRIPSSSSLIFVTPGNQCPTGAILSPERARTLHDSAQANDQIIIEDDYGAAFVGDPTLPPALKSSDRNGRVVYIGSFSKVIAPGLRIGYVVAPAPFIRELRALRRLMLRHPPVNNQHVTSLFISLGYADVHIQKFTAALHERSVILNASLKARLPTWEVRGKAPASSVWVRAPVDVDANCLARAGADRGLIIEPGDIFYSDPDGPKNFFRLGFASVPANRIDFGNPRSGGSALASPTSRLDKDKPRH